MKIIRSYNLETFDNLNFWHSELTLFEYGRQVELLYKSGDQTLSAKHDYYFFALIDIRLKLEKFNQFLLCNGARIDVYPSGMSVIGTLAYELIPGKKAERLVEIFEPARERKKIASVVDQKAYREEWFKTVTK
jgi:hypothetical protein